MCTGIEILKIPISANLYMFSDSKSIRQLYFTPGADGIGYDYGTSTLSSLNELEFISFDEGIKYFGDGLFRDCKFEVRISTPDTLIGIGDFCFAGWVYLTELDLSRVETIGRYAFSGCTGLVSIKLPEKVDYLGDYAFKDCTSISSLVVPDSKMGRPIDVILGCMDLNSLTIPVTYRLDIGVENSLEHVTFVPGSNGECFDYSNTDWEQFHNIRSVSFRDGIISFGQYFMMDAVLLNRLFCQIRWSVLNMGPFQIVQI